ncbi:hypothetical protein ACMFWY_13780 [Roseiconus sp. JC912]
MNSDRNMNLDVTSHQLSSQRTFALQKRISQTSRLRIEVDKGQPR